MPLYMDLHKGLQGVSMDEIDHIHEADLDVQDQFGVKVHKFWVNEKAGTVFCLMEAADKQACINTHTAAHGMTACEIVEVQPSDVLLLMGSGATNEIGRAMHSDGQYDSSVRTFLFTDITGSTDLTHRIGDSRAISVIRRHNEIVRSSIVAHDGKEVKHTGDGIMAVFISAVKAVGCAVDIQARLEKLREVKPGFPLHVHIGVNTGEPITEGNDFFGVAVQLAARLCSEAKPDRVLVSNIVKELCMGKDLCFTDSGQIGLKGFSVPVSAFEVSACAREPQLQQA